MELIKPVFQNYLNPAFNLQEGIANKNRQENVGHNNFTGNSHNEKLNDSKSETNCTDDVQINNRQSCDHVKLCQPESSNCPRNENNYANNINNKEKETGNKQNVEKRKGKTHIYTLRQDSKTRECLYNYEKTAKYT